MSSTQPNPGHALKVPVSRGRNDAPTSQTCTLEGRYTQSAGSAASGSLVSTSSDPDLNITHTSNLGLRCFRIANVPPGWSEDMLLAALGDADPLLKDQKPQISLYPCIDSTETQTALLSLGTCTEYFRWLMPDDFNYFKTSDGTLLVIDSHFYDLTPLNSPKGEIVADVAAVTGLAAMHSGLGGAVRRI
ncbi:hypothetical protein BDD12DRAFT_882260 [Trichophaea hybrida]|nr:hypothetical protein BDD12DRAFT_882260 [Trichophaea hybrida]